MTISPDQDHQGDHLRRLEAIERDLDRLGELTGPYVTDPKEDLSAAAARIPDADQQQEAEELLDRLRSVIEPRGLPGWTVTAQDLGFLPIPRHGGAVGMAYRVQPIRWIIT